MDARAFIPTHRPVIEEFTGPVRNCPRGYVAMEGHEARLHPDRFVGLAYHFNDSMMVSTQEQAWLQLATHSLD